VTRWSRLWRENWLTVLVIAGLAVGYLLLRTSPSQLASADEFVTGLQQGQPTIVEFYSNT
jgi:hypothetical protein